MDTLAQNEEVWKPVVGYEGWYEVSSLGRVKRVAPGVNAKVGMIKRHTPNHSGYHRIKMSVDGQRVSKPVHALVARAFLGECPDGYQVNHKDGNKANNHVDNLEYLTPKQNIKHALENGLQKQGEKHYRSILTEDQAKEIKQLKGIEFSGTVAKKYNVSKGAVKSIWYGISWKHIK